MKKLFFISLSAALLWIGSAATFAQVDVSDPEALIKTATQQIDYRLEKTGHGWRLYDWNVQRRMADSDVSAAVRRND